MPDAAQNTPTLRGNSLLNSELLGLPEGVRAVAYRRGEIGEFGMVDVGSAAGIGKYKSAGISATIIVAPKDGWSFIEGGLGFYNAVRILDQPKRFSVVLEANHQGDIDAIEKLKDHPAFVSMEEIPLGK